MVIERGLEDAANALELRVGEGRGRGAAEYLPPYTDEHGTVWYPVRHALGGIVSSLTLESQKLWQDYANKQATWLAGRRRGK